MIRLTIRKWSSNNSIPKGSMRCWFKHCFRLISSFDLLILFCLCVVASFYAISISMTKKVFYILLWNRSDMAPFTFFNETTFITNNCTHSNCFVTDNRDYFGGDLSPFHAIAFNGRMLEGKVKDIPRWPHQKFIYYNTEPSASIHIIDKNYNGFFNWTATYRLDSDIPYPYILIRNKSNHIIGPRINMKWKENMTDIDDDVASRIRNKTKFAATFVSNCFSRSGREDILYFLYTELAARGLGLDVYGKCGPETCDRSLGDYCDKLVEKYYFYLSLENSLCQDYVTEKLLRALNHYAVPVVLGKADYSRFLPPGSYLNAREYPPTELVEYMFYLFRRPEKYRQFFGWRKHYSYHDPMSRENVCALCAALNNKTKYETVSEYPDIMTWWNDV